MDFFALVRKLHEPLLVLSAVLLFLGCSPFPPEQLRIVPESIELRVGSSRQLAAEIIGGTTPQYLGAPETLRWSSSNHRVFTISRTGFLIANNAGEARITATLSREDGSTLTASAIARAEPPAVELQSLSLTPTNGTMELRSTLHFAATAHLSNGTTSNVNTSALWRSSDPTIASINDTGVATAHALGVTTITASLMGATATTTLTVTPAAIVSISLDPVSASLAPGENITLTASAERSDGTRESVHLHPYIEWRSSNPYVASVQRSDQGGLVSTGSMEGTATITARIGDVISSPAIISVGAFEFTPVSIYPLNPIAVVGTSTEFHAIAASWGFRSFDVTSSATFTSSTPAVATPLTEAPNTFRCSAPGETRITATFQRGTATTTLRCIAFEPAQLVIQPPVASIARGTTLQLSAVLVYTDGTTRGITNAANWESSDSTIASVSTLGVVAGLAEGNTQITASFSGLRSNAVPLMVTAF